MSLFVVSLGHGSIQEGRAAMLMGDIDISMLMVYVQHVQEEKLRDREEYKNKKAKLSLRHHRLMRLRLETKVSIMVYTPKLSLHIHKVVWRMEVVSLLLAQGVVGINPVIVVMAP